MPLPRPRTAAWLLGVAVPLAPLGLVHAQAQAPSTTTLRTPSAEFADPFTRVSGLRELSDGRVVVADQQEKRLQVIDFRTGVARAIGREGGGPNEWRLPTALFPLAGDSTLVHDMGNMRYLVIAPDGTPAYTFSLADASAADGPAAAPAAAPAGSAAGRAAGGIRIAGGPGNVGATMFALRGPAGIDRAGRLYFQDAAMRMEGGAPQSADSAAITRMHRATRAVDTVAHIPLPPTRVETSSSGNNRMVMMRPQAPYQMRDIWTVAPDGRIAIVRAEPYRVDWVAPGGTVTRGPANAYRPIRITDADREEFQERRRTSGNAVSVQIGGGGTNVQVGAAARGGGAAPSLPPIADADWPESKPPFEAGAARVAPNGHLWVLRTRPAGDDTPVYDVFDGAGRVVRRVALPEGTSLVGFGTRSLYLTLRDDDDLLHLQRFDVPELLGQR